MVWRYTEVGITSIISVSVVWECCFLIIISLILRTHAPTVHTCVHTHDNNDLFNTNKRAYYYYYHYYCVLCISRYVCMYVRACVSVWVLAYMRECACVRTYVCVCMHAQKCVHARVCAHMCVVMRVHTCMCVRRMRAMTRGNNTTKLLVLR